MSLGSRTSKLETFFITDQSRIDAFDVCKNLAKDAHVILRDYDNPTRTELAKDLQKLCRKLGLKFIIAKTPDLAIELKADGVHFPQFMASQIGKWRKLKPSWIITAAVHNQKEISTTQHADFYFISPIFKTKSHPNKKPLGVDELRQLILQNGNKSFVALGGIDQNTIKKLENVGIAGIAGISGIDTCGEYATKQL